MSAISGVNLAMMPEDEAEFLDWLTTTGDIWATADLRPSGTVRCKPRPVTEFRERCASTICQNSLIRMYVGHREDVLKPRIHTVKVSSQRRREIDLAGSLLVFYQHGIVDDEGVLERTNVYYHTSYLTGNAWQKKPADWVKWARAVVRRLKQAGTEQVPVYDCNYSIPATHRAKQAVDRGLKVV